jgi:hypothetical protein
MADGVDGAFAFRAAVVVPRGVHLVTVRYSAMAEFALFTNPAESVWDIGLLYGRHSKSRWAYASVSAGLGLVGGMRRGPNRTDLDEAEAYSQSPFGWMAGFFSTAEYEEDPFFTVGVPFEVDLGFTFSSRMGIGATAFGNLNSGRSTVGGTVQLVLGRLR